MPGNLLFADTTMPSVTGDTKTDIKRILNHMYMLQEELRYTLGNLSGDNFNDTGLIDLSGIVTADLSITVQSVSDKADANAASIITINGDVSDQGAALTLIAGYTGQDGVVTIATTALWAALTPKVTTTVYYVTQESKYKKYNGTAWVDCNNISEAAFTLSAINGQSAVSLSADRIDFTGFATFVRPADIYTESTTTIDGGKITVTSIPAAKLETGSVVLPTDIYSTGTTTIDGGKITTNTIDGSRIITNSLATETLEAIDGGNDYSYIAMLNGLDFRDTDHMIFDASTYIPYKRSVQGLHALVFHGDTVLTAQGKGTTNNEPTAVTGYIRNMQSDTGTVTQTGLEVVSSKKLTLLAQRDGSTGTGVEMWSRDLASCAEGGYYYRLLVSDSGILAAKFRKVSGAQTAIDATTIWS